MSFVVKEIDEILVMSDSEIMNYVLESSRQQKEFVVKKNRLEDDLRFNQSITIDDVKHAFNFNHEECIYTFPFLDEREINKKYLNGGYKVPARGFFWVIDVEVNKRELGLVEVNFSIGKMIRIPNDSRFLRDDKPEFEETKKFYFDYERERYIQLPNDISNKNKISQKSFETDKHSKEFERRKKCLNAIYRRFARIEEDYAERLDTALKGLKVISYKANNLRSVLTDFQDFQIYLKEFFPVKMLFSHVTLREYNLVIDYIKFLEKQVQNMFDEISDVCFEFGDEDLDFTDSKYHHELKVTDAQKHFHRLKNRLIEFLKPKDISEINAFENSSGYVKKDGKYFPSLGTIELRRSLTEVPGRESEWKEYEEKLYGVSS